ncbi:hypothetical protein [Acetobacterium bakii]|uniref:Flagellar protein FliT n=1 Tax=Acetobacterium bakii TaxID=52689 RepID=A0A0L6U078_9FIRM|nr:hypothetical protein [Acetobacterium bakii]KNZ41752.1 hypothetical protein AKG39_08940 [Acetobacterium bakii]
MSNNTNDYCREKIRLLKEYISKSEEVLSNVEQWELLNDILSEREYLIQKLQILEAENKAVMPNCSQDQRTEIDGLVRLILDIDKDGIKMIEAEKKKIIGELKINQQSQKVSDYQQKSLAESGRLLDYKK